MEATANIPYFEEGTGSTIERSSTRESTVTDETLDESETLSEPESEQGTASESYESALENEGLSALAAPVSTTDSATASDTQKPSPITQPDIPEQKQETQLSTVSTQPKSVCLQSNL